MKSFAFGSSALAVLLLALSGVEAQTIVEGTLSAGPSTQGDCTATGSNTYLCSNGAYCTWSAGSSGYSCVGGSGEVEETAAVDASAGPPGRTCTAHQGHFDCEDGSFCELTDNVWVCEGGSGSSEEGAESGSTCIVHGGHTHGDCSGQCNGVDLGAYNMGLHILSVFIVLISSAIGVFLPLIASSFMTKSLFSNIFFAAKHFGTGIIISTAFIHLLYHSFVMFSNACLGELKFEPAAAAITMAGTYTVFAVDFFVMRWLNARSAKRVARNAAVNADGPQDSPSAPSSTDGKHAEAFGHSHGPLPEVGMDMASPQAHFDVQILEAGIIFHSIMIGVSLGASGGAQWTPLFCAIVFHQLFEGLALGSRIGTLIFPAGRGLKKWIMGGIFALITPIGIAIGIAVHSGYNPNSGAALLSIGVLDAISAGILIYAGIIEMLYHDFMLGELSTAKKGRVALAFFFLLAGSICMSVLGKWA